MPRQLLKTYVLHVCSAQDTAWSAEGLMPWLLLQEKAASRNGSGDEMIISAGDFLMHALKPAARRLAWERSALCGVAFAAVGE